MLEPQYYKTLSKTQEDPEKPTGSKLYFDVRISKPLFTDDGALWVRGGDINNLINRMQSAINRVERWSQEWGIHLSVEKKKVNPAVDLRLYEQK